MDFLIFLSEVDIPITTDYTFVEGTMKCGFKSFSDVLSTFKGIVRLQFLPLDPVLRSPVIAAKGHETSAYNFGCHCC